MLRLATAALVLAVIGPAYAADHAAVFTYHRFGENTLPSTNIRMEQFEAHVAYLRDGGFVVLPLSEIVAAMRKDRDLPDRAVAITVDDAYLSAYTHARPVLKAAGFPWTMFVATEPVDQKQRNYMSWDQLRELAAEGVEIGSQSATHPHMPAISLDEAAEEVERSTARIAAEIGVRPTLFAYPYGEASLAVRDLVAEAGYVAAFGQHSGVAVADDDRYYLPRFAMNERYGGLERFKTLADALPLPVSEVTPPDMTVTPDTNPPALGFTVTGDLGSLDRLACYSGTQGRLAIEPIGNRVEIRLTEPLAAGRERVNCTMPGPDGRWRWWGRQFYTLN